MVIDFHTHAFPDDLAEKALDTILANINYIYTPVSSRLSPNNPKLKKPMSGLEVFARIASFPSAAFIPIPTIINGISISWSA